MIKLFGAYVSDRLREELDTAVQSGYSFELRTSTKSLEIVAYGWSEQFERFFNHAIDSLNPHVAPLMVEAVVAPSTEVMVPPQVDPVTDKTIVIPEAVVSFLQTSKAKGTSEEIRF